MSKFEHNPGLLALRSGVRWANNIPYATKIMPTIVTPARAREIHASMVYADSEAAYVDSVVDQHPGGIGWVDALLMIAESEPNNTQTL